MSDDQNHGWMARALVRSVTRNPHFRLPELTRECLAEVLGTFILITFGDGVVAQVTASRASIAGSDGYTAGDYNSISVTWGLAVTFGVYCSSGVSGAHLNPAVTVSLASHRGFPWYKVPYFILSQFLGAFLGALTVFLVYYDAFSKYFPDKTVANSGGVFATFPQAYLTTAGSVGDQMVGTGLLVLMIFALTDKLNASPLPSNFLPVLVGAVVTAIGFSFGFNCGFPINPARDLAPRVFLAIAGWGSDAFTDVDDYWWVPVVIPILGGFTGGLLYDLLVGIHHPTMPKPVQPHSASEFIDLDDDEITNGGDLLQRPLLQPQQGQE
eukprot:GFYU01001073.1.p1 GENE.GFYU01001073.1~~GFYU01001073.1.p1  ORF type:complete len:325 (+),score=63.96 GFYU01001073.1:66-1040(+)